MDLASVVAALASVGVRVSGSAPNSSVQVDSSRACPPGLAGPEPSGTIHDLGQHFHWAPPRCPYRPHLSAGNKVGYARDRWPAARGGTGLEGWPMGLTKSTPHGTYCGSCPVRGCG